MGFNSILAYEFGTHDIPTAEQFLDRATVAGLQVFYALNGFLNIPPYNQPNGTEWTTSIVNKFRNHTALAAWYICDERPPRYLPILQARHDLVRRLDPDHITFSVLDHGETISMYTNISESLGVDPYPFHHDGDNVTEMVSEIDSLITSLRRRNDRTSVCVTQIFSWETYGSNCTEPPAAAKRAMAFAAFALGCRGVILYSYYDLFLAYSPPNTPYPNRTRAAEEVIERRLSDLKLLGQEINALEGVLLGDVTDAATAVGSLPAGVIAGMRCSGQGAKECTLIVVNTTPREQSFEFVAGATPAGGSLMWLAGPLAPFGVTILAVPHQSVV